VPLSKIQADVLRLLASHRDPESYIAGSTPLNRGTSRYSGDIDIFQDRAERVQEVATNDAAALEAAGYGVSWMRRLDSIQTAEVSKEGETTRLDWVADIDYRFFPAVRDEMFGYVLHPADLAMNKAMAAAGRREVRDIVDLVTFHERVLPLGAVVWAAVDKSPGFTPEGLIAEIRRNSRYSKLEWESLSSSEPIDASSVLQRLRSALDEAEAFVSKMPTHRAGLLFLKEGRVVQPDAERLAEYETHAGRRRGQWPSSLEIESAMFERYLGG